MANRSAAGNRLIDRRTVLQGAAVLTAAGPALMREGHAAAPPPVVIDAQVHAYAANTPERPWHSVPNWPAHVTGDEMVAAMDKVGVNLNLSIPLSQKRGTAPYTRPLILQCSPIGAVFTYWYGMESHNTTVIHKPVEASETNRLISSEKVDGTAVYNSAGDHLGAVHHLMIDKFTGHVEYAVMSFGGFLGMGESYHPLPWRALTYNTSLGGYCVDLDRARLERSPHYTMRSQPDWSDRTYRDRIDQYWVRPL